LSDGSSDGRRFDINIGSGSGQISLSNSAAEFMRLTPTGVGIGTTSPTDSFSFVGCVDLASTTGGFYYVRDTDATNAIGGFGLSGTDMYIVNKAAGNIRFFCNNETNERARIDSSGRLLVGTSTPLGNSDAQTSFIQNFGNSGGNFQGGRINIGRAEFSANITAGEQLGGIYFSDAQSGTYGVIECVADGTGGTNDFPGRLVFSTTADGASSPTERMRITNNGQLRTLAAQTAFLLSSATSAGTSEALIEGKYSGTATGGGTTSFVVYTNGDVQNTNNAYGSLSDIKLKENIVDASSQWDDLKALQVRNYNFKEGQTHTQIGLVAQEVELVSPGLVSESPDRDEDGNDLGTVTKSVNYSVLYMKAVKALQEAMERIEVLEAKVNALEGN